LGNMLLFRNCIFSNNNGNGHAAALYNKQSSPGFVNCLFTSNNAPGDGGTIY